MARPQTSRRNPPSTRYVRPTERKFYIWQDRGIRWDSAFARKRGLESRPWRWCCTLCDPPSYGYRTQKGAFQLILKVSMPRHMFVRQQHHEHVARTRK